MIATNQFKNGVTIKIGNEIYSLVSFQHVKPGKGGAFVRTRLKNLRNGKMLDKTFRAGEKVEKAFLKEKKIQFLYRQGNSYHFMDQETFEEVELTKVRLEGKEKLLKENMLLSMLMHKGEIVEIDLPNFVVLKVKETGPGVRADTVKAANKTAILETGAEIDVPLFINKGDVLKIDTRSNAYVSRE